MENRKKKNTACKQKSETLVRAGLTHFLAPQKGKETIGTFK
jgi:hypothetical protein